MRYVYDRSTDSLAISFADGRRYRDSEEIFDGVVIDYDTAGRPIGIEFSDRASRYVDTSGLADGRWVEITHPDILPRKGSMTGAEIRARRQELGMTQEQLAEQLDTTKNTIARWERDEVRIEHGGMVRLALEALRPQSQRLEEVAKKLKAARTGTYLSLLPTTKSQVRDVVVRNAAATGGKISSRERTSRRSSKKR